MENRVLIRHAASVIQCRQVKGGSMGDVGAALLTHDGEVFTGVCAATGSNTICAEQMALGGLITQKKYVFKAIVAVWKDENGNLFVIPPCGNCRQFMYEIDRQNLEAQVILSTEHSMTLRELLPVESSWQKVEN